MYRSAPSIPTTDVAALLAAVYANPDDIAARLVYADALTELGDPRGEFIARQCNGDDARELLAAHRRDWLGPLAPILHAKGSDFVNGFLTTARVRNEKHDQQLAAAGDPRWSTVVELDFVHGVPMTAIPLVRSSAMRSLRRVAGVEVDVLAALCSGGALPIRAIEARATPFLERLDETQRDELTTAIEHAPGLPELRRLALAADSHWYHLPYLRWLVGSTLAGRLATLELAGFGSELHAWAELLPDAHPALGELVVRDGRGTAYFRRGNDGRLSALELDVRGALVRDDPEPRVAQIARRLLTTVTITQ